MDGTPASKKAKLKIDYGTQVVTLQEVEDPEITNVFDIEQDIEEVLDDDDDAAEEHDGDREIDENIEFEEEITYSMKLPENFQHKFQKVDGSGGKIILCQPDETVETVKNTWTRGMTCVLIEEYRKMKLDFQDPYKKQKDLWIKLAENMCHRGCDVTWDMCDQKWRNLKHTFKSIYYNKHRSEKSKRRWDFYGNLEDIFKPLLENENMRRSNAHSPTHSQDEDSNLSTSRTVELSNVTASKASDVPKKIQLRSRVEPVIYSHVIFNENGASNSSSTCQIPSNSHNNSEVDYTVIETVPDLAESAPPWFQEFIKQYRADESHRLNLIKKMHTEILEVERRKCDALEALLKKLSE